MNIKLPPLFEDKLQGHDREKGIVYTALASFGAWFETSGTPPFFRDYTDHGLKHINSILATSAAMVRKEAADVLTAGDATVFILATLLHDSALHLAEPGFHQLILGDARDQHIAPFDKKPWPALWEEFLFSARHWDDRKLSAVFGSEFVQKGDGVSNPFDHWSDLTRADYQLIGEFIRGHHSRLAHEFAVFGVPGIRPDFLTLPVDVSEEWRDLSGVIARSHGIPLRTCLDYIGSRFHKREYQGIHAIYLMALLRLADYVQIEANRAPEIVFHYRVLPSRTSKLEWKAHHAVKNITPEHEDPESVEVRAEPPDIETYLRLREWLDGIQNELDSSWAVLGEVYGRYPKLRELGLNWRRIRSNLDDYATFAGTVSYVPRRIRLEVARAEMLSLLIGPLYGDDPSYGVRELIQNAVDAVREREYMQEHFPQYTNVELREQPADVVVWLSDFDKKANCAWLEISDRGVGMTEKVLIDYFLTAGASYRYSEEWQRTFEYNDLPPDKTKTRSMVLRSGRFGIGALATFLLGNEIEVETRHISSSEGFRFKMSLTQEQVQVERVQGLKVGTSIRVRMTDAAFEKLKKSPESTFKPSAWEWYILNKPTVLRLRGKNKEKLQTQFNIDLHQWHKLEVQLPYTVHWSFMDNSPCLSCNGIFISNSDKLPLIFNEKRRDLSIGINTPAIHISDPDGHLPLGLTRRDLTTDEYGFEIDLTESVMKDYFAYILQKFPENIDTQAMFSMLNQQVFSVFPSHTFGKDALTCLLSTVGFCLPHVNAIAALQKPVQHVLLVSGRNAISLLSSIDKWDCVFLNSDTWLLSNSAFRPKHEIHYQFFSISGINDDEKVATLKHFRLAKIKQKNHGKEIEFVHQMDSDEYPDMIQHKLSYRKNKLWPEKKIEMLSDVWMVETKGMPDCPYPFSRISGDFREANENQFCEFNAVASEYIFREPWNPDMSFFKVIDKWWERFFGNEWIPWKKADRRAKFSETYRELAPYLERYEN